MGFQGNRIGLLSFWQIIRCYFFTLLLGSLLIPLFFAFREVTIQNFENCFLLYLAVLVVALIVTIPACSILVLWNSMIKDKNELITRISHLILHCLLTLITVFSFMWVIDLGQEQFWGWILFLCYAPVGTILWDRQIRKAVRISVRKSNPHV